MTSSYIILLALWSYHPPECFTEGHHSGCSIAFHLKQMITMDLEVSVAVHWKLCCLISAKPLHEVMVAQNHYTNLNFWSPKTPVTHAHISPLCWINLGNIKYIFIWYQFSQLRWHQQLKSFLVEDKDPFILPSQYHVCWWPGDIRSQGISSNGIDLSYHSIFSFSPSRIIEVWEDDIQSQPNFQPNWYTCPILLT